MQATVQPWQPSGAARFFGVAIQPRTCCNLAYLLLAFPLGVAYFVMLVTGFSLGVGLAVTLLGVPIILVTLVAVRACAALERMLTNALLGTALPQPSVLPTPAGGLVARIKTLVGSPRTWKEMAFLCLQFPLGTLAFVVALVLATVPPYLLFLPIYYRWTDFYYAPYHRVDTFADALFFVPIGALLIPVSLHAINGVAALYRRYVVALLGDIQDNG
jgi:hypothetical protein